MTISRTAEIIIITERITAMQQPMTAADIIRTATAMATNIIIAAREKDTAAVVSFSLHITEVSLQAGVVAQNERASKEVVAVDDAQYAVFA